jgi:hypothetical protein
MAWSIVAAPIISIGPVFPAEVNSTVILIVLVVELAVEVSNESRLDRLDDIPFFCMVWMGWDGMGWDGIVGRDREMELAWKCIINNDRMRSQDPSLRSV